MSQEMISQSGDNGDQCYNSKVDKDLGIKGRLKQIVLEAEVSG